MHPSHLAAAILITAGAAIALALTVLAIGSWRQTKDARLLWVAAAFAAFMVKHVVTAGAIFYEAIGHEHLELVGSAFDLVIVGLLIGPFIFRS